MYFLGIDQQKLEELGAIHTAREIQQQPDVWLKIYDLVREQAGEIKNFLKKGVEDTDEIILTGAGTSAFIGQCLTGDFKRNMNTCVQAIPTTEMVTHPKNYFNKGKKVFLISFARSGNSPESCATIDLAEKFSANVYHLVITCNADGKLLNDCSKLKQYNIVLPEEANDKSLAMTSSYTGMLLTGLLVSRIRDIEKEKDNVETLVKYGEKIFSRYLDDLRRVARMDFHRAVFLGSGPQTGTATESQLKLQELTDGKIICKSDSFLGLRHGPKAVIDATTLIVNLFSNDPYVLLYEKDLLESLKKGQQPMYRIGIAENQSIIDKLGEAMDLNIILSDSNSHLDEEYLAICNVIPAQILGTYTSIEKKLQPDNPSVSGAISRVVEGVKIYPL